MTDNEINKAVAERVMGWSFGAIYELPWVPHCWQTPNGCKAHHGPFNPTESHDDFMLAVGKLTKEQAVIFIHALDELLDSIFDGASPGGDREVLAVFALFTAPLPTKCLALLEAVKG